MNKLDIFDVGHGDSMLFTVDDQNLYPLLIDTGKKKDQIYKRINCEKFNIMITHQDLDHMGGIEELFKYKSNQIRKIYIPLYIPEIIKIFSRIILMGKNNMSTINNINSMILNNLSKINFVYEGYNKDYGYELGRYNEILNPPLKDFDHFQKKDFKKFTYEKAIEVLNEMDIFSDNFVYDYIPEYTEGLSEELISSKIKYYKYIVRAIAFNFKNKKNISKKVKANRLNKLFTISSNNISIILKYEEDFSILFTGDAGDKVINKLIYKQLVKNIDVLKIPHHGGKNSVEKNILKTLKPSYGILSHGNRKFNRGSVPTNTTISELIKNNVNILATNNFSTNIYKQKGRVSHNIKGLDIHFK